jgi:pyruvate,orthophosphate dikinase
MLPRPFRDAEVSTAVPKYVYDLSEGSAAMKPLLGGKGANVAEMRRIGVPVPDGFTVTTEACVETMRRNARWPAGLWDEILERLAALEDRTGRRLGDAERPLLVSVRSGAWSRCRDDGHDPQPRDHR